MEQRDETETGQGVRGNVVGRVWEDCCNGQHTFTGAECATAVMKPNFAAKNVDLHPPTHAPP